MVVNACRAQQEAAEGLVGWFDATIDAAHWFSLNDVLPHHAAMLLCQFDPNDEQLEQAQLTTTDATEPRDLVRLVQRFEDLARTSPRPRPLLQWLQEARQMGVRYHPWVDEYVDAVGLERHAQSASAVVLAASVVSRPAAPVRHRLQTKTEPLRAVIELAKKKAVDADDYHSVWAALETLAQLPHPPAPLVGWIEEGIQYRKPGRDDFGVLKLAALRERFGRAKLSKSKG